MRIWLSSFAVGFGDEDSADVEDLKVEQYPPTPLNGKWGFAEVNQSWIGPPDGILSLSSSSPEYACPLHKLKLENNFLKFSLFCFKRESC